MRSWNGSNDSLINVFQTLSLNSSTANASLATVLLNDQHRYLLLKYFNNEGTFTLTTQGSTTATLVAGLVAGATSATLQSSWPTSYPNCHQLIVLPDGEQRDTTFTQGSTQITWQAPLVVTSSTTATTLSAGTQATLNGVQAYRLPPNVSKIKNDTITVGQLVYTPAPVQSIQEWTKLNALPYNSNIPAYFYIYNNELLFWPIPSSSGEPITVYCQITIPDMSYADNTTGTISAMTPNSSSITGSATTFSTGSSIPKNVDLTFANIFFTAMPPNGDGLSYQVQSIQSDTALTLKVPVVYAPSGTSGTLKLGQYPLLHPDFHDMIVYGALRIYFSSIVKDTDRFTLFNNLFHEKEEQMKFYLSTKSVNVDLSVTPVLSNPNLFILG